MSSDVSVGLVAKLSESVGVSEPALRLLLSVLTGYPLAIIHRQFFCGKNVNLQHIFFILTGFAIGYWNYGFDMLHSAVAIIFTYLTLIVLNGSVYSVIVIFLFNMSYLLIGYYYAGTDDYDINWTMPQCVLVLRLIGLAFDYYDGHQPVENLSKDSKALMLVQRPNLLEMFGHMMFPISVLVGPQFGMKRYLDFVNGVYNGEKTPNVPPKSVNYAILRFILGVVYLILFQLLGFAVSDDYILSDTYRNQNFLYRMLLLGIWGRYTLYKYISCWLLSEGACILIGLTHNGYDDSGNVKWNGLENVNLRVLENATEFNHYIQSFNINTNHWVAQYVYKRLKFLGNRLISQAAALLFLAMWHGFHSGYYTCFFFEFIVIYMEKDLRSIINSNENVSKQLEHAPLNIILYLLQRLYAFVFMGWCLLPFALLTFERYWKAYGAVNYSGFILFGLWPFVYGPIIRFFLAKKRRDHVD